MFKKLRKVYDVCPICEEKRDLIYGKQRESLKVSDEEIEVESKVYYCTTGDHYFHGLEDEEEKFRYAYREYRKRKGLLQPEKIKQIRRKYGLSQREFAQFLGFGEITIHRYETGAIQDDAHNNTLFLMQDTETFKRLFKQKRNSLSEKIINKIELKLKGIEDEERQLALNFYQPDLRIVFKDIRRKSDKLSSEAFPLRQWLIDKYMEGEATEYIIQEKKEELALAA